MLSSTATHHFAIIVPFAVITNMNHLVNTQSCIPVFLTLTYRTFSFSFPISTISPLGPTC